MPQIFTQLWKQNKTVKLFSVLIGLLIASLTVFAASQLSKLNTKYSFEQFFPASHPLLMQSQKIRQTFQLENSSSFLIVLEKREGSWLEPEQMKKLKATTEKMKIFHGVQNAISIATLEGALEDGHDLVIGPLYDRLPVKKWESYTKSNQLIDSQLISHDRKSTLLLVEPKKLNPNALLDLSQSLSFHLKKELPDTRIKIGGAPAIQARFSERLFRELKLFLALSLVIFGVIFLLFFRGISAFALTFTSLMISNLLVIGALAYWGIPFSVLLSTLPIIISIALISLMIHSLHRWAEVLQSGQAPQTLSERFLAALHVMHEMFLPNFLGSLTTAIGFITLCFANIPLIRQYGYVVAVAVMGTWITTQLILMGFMCYSQPVLRGWTKTKSYWTLGILKNSTSLFVVLLLCTLFMSYMGRSVNFSGRLFDDLPETEKVRQATEKIDKKFGGVITYDLILTSNKKDFWKEPQNLSTLDKSINQIRHLPQVGSSLSLPDFMSEPKPKSKAGVAEFLFLFSMAEMNPLKNYITENADALRVAIRFHDLPSQEISDAKSRILRVVRTQFPQVKITESGIGVISHTLNHEVSKDLVVGFWHSLVLIGLLLLLIFRSLRWALVACLPNLIPPTVLLGLMALMQTPIKPGVALIFSIALGLAFNNTVYLLSRLKRLMHEKGMTTLPLRRTLLQEGNPCLFETLIMFCGFAIFLVSDFKANQIFGAYMVLSIVAGALGDLVFLPAMLNLIPSLLKERKSPGFLKAATTASLAILAIMIPTRAHADAAAEDVLKKVQKQIDSKDDEASVKIKIIEANGETKTRSLELQTLRKNKFYAIARIQSPADIKGTALLSEINGDTENQWLYLPSNKQIRRVVNVKKGNGILGSELTIEDLNASLVRGAQVSILKKDAQMIILQITPKPGSSAYNKILSSVSAKDYLPQKTQYFKNNKISKTVEFLDYKKIDGQVWRSQLIKVRNLVNKRGTDLTISDAKANVGLKENDFTVNSLKND